MAIKKNTPAAPDAPDAAQTTEAAAPAKAPAKTTKPAPKATATKPAATKSAAAATPAPEPTTAPDAAPAAPSAPLEKVSRKELALAIQEKVRAAGKAVPLSIAEIMVLAYEEAVGEAMAGMKEVVLPGFGKFLPVAKEAAQKRNPSTGEQVTVPAHTAVRFKVGTKLKATANNGTAVADDEEAGE